MPSVSGSLTRPRTAAALISVLLTVAGCGGASTRNDDGAALTGGGTGSQRPAVTTGWAARPGRAGSSAIGRAAERGGTAVREYASPPPMADRLWLTHGSAG